jgi:hypothetical protein
MCMIIEADQQTAAAGISNLAVIHVYEIKPVVYSHNDSSISMSIVVK